MGDDRTHTDRPLTCLEHCALHKRTIRLTCPDCGGVRRYDAIALWWMFERKGWDDGIRGAAKHFYCATCHKAGRKVRPKLEISRERPDDEQPPYPDERTWKRLGARYRS